MGFRVNSYRSREQAWISFKLDRITHTRLESHVIGLSRKASWLLMVKKLLWKEIKF
jgi:hypothetical protein